MQFLQCIHYIGEVILKVLSLSINDNEYSVNLPVCIFSGAATLDIISVDMYFGSITEKRDEFNKRSIISDNVLVHDYWIVVLDIDNELQYSVFT